MNKPRSYARPLADLANPLLAGSFARQGFASAELVTRWPDIVGAEIAQHAEPLKMQWPRTPDGETPEPGTLMLRVEGPAAIEI
ncbi:MAG: DciA family protein, partial [Pseudorhodoplanes sp.]|nr:DciA family protein [Pseudorhodoplanes sp.]